MISKLQKAKWVYFALIFNFLMMDVFSQDLAFTSKPDALNIRNDQKSFLLSDALKHLETTFGISFMFDPTIIKGKKIDRLSSTGTVEEQLQNILEPLKLSFKKIDKGYYVIQEESGKGNNLNRKESSLLNNSSNESLMPFGMDNKISMADPITVRGKVTGQDTKDGLPGVSIVIKGTTTGTTTDASGDYSINVPETKSILVFSYIGYAPQEITVNSRSTINLVLSPDVAALNEVVVIGYGTVKKTDLTGSVTTIDPGQVTKRGSTGTLEGLQGQAAGVDVSSSTGRPGSGFKVQIRGQQSLNGGNPLYVVDGVITDNIDFINPQDIERIDILKDASSTAIYGSRGAYGVVIVTTKRGSSVKQKAVISYDGYYGVRKAARLPDFMDGEKWWEFRQNSFITGSLQAKTKYDTLAGNNAANKTELWRRVKDKDFTDWPGMIIQNGAQMNHYFTASGMADKMGYIIGAGYQQEKGNIAHEDYKRYNFKVNLNHSLNKHWNAGAGLNLAIIDAESGSSNAIVESFRMSPLLKPNFTDDPSKLILQPGKDLPYIDMTSSVNPLYDLEHASNNTRTFNAIGNLYLEYLPLEWLSLKTTLQPRFKYDKIGKFNDTNTEGKIGVPADAEAKVLESFSYNWDNQITINKTINDHSFNFMALYSMNLFRDEMLMGAATSLPYNSSYQNLSTADPDKQRSGSFYSKQTLMSYALRLNYALKDKYLLTISNRWDGASPLAEGRKWSFFPSAAVAWKISEEGFLSGVGAINTLKARVSVGMTGNNQAVRPYDTRMNASTTTVYDFGGAVASGYAPGSIVSERLSWEKVTEVDAGIDFAVLQSRISGSVDYYNKLTDGVIISRKLPIETGGYFDLNIQANIDAPGPRVKDNIGKVRNSGIEVALNTVNISTSNFTWQTSFNFSRNKNEIVEIDGKRDDVGNGWFIGQPINVNYNYVFDGIIQEGETVPAGQSVGQAKVKDFDSDGVTPVDRRILGSPMPDWIGGFSTTFTYKGFDLSGSLFTRQGVQVLSYFHQEFLNFEDRGRAKLDVDYYMPANDVTPARASNEYPQPKNGGKYWNTDNVGFYKDASFVKVKNITLGYNFPASLVEKMKMQSLRVYINVLNPFVFTKYDGFDPEWADSPFAPLTNGIANGGSGGLSSVTYQFGLNVKF